MDNFTEFKLLTLGNSKVGKTSFILKYTEDTFTTNTSTTIGIDYKDKYEILKNNQKVKIAIYDTNGQERFKSLSLNYLKKADGILLFYDITDKESFDSIKEWMQSIYEIKDNNFPIVLIGNKIDLEDERIVTKEEGESESVKYNIKFYETSCKDNINIKESILFLIYKILGNIQEEKDKEKNENIVLNTEKHKKKKHRRC